VELRVEERDGRGTWSGHEGGERVAFLTFTRRADTLLVDYVRTLPRFGGRGVGTRLVLAAAARMREEGLHVMPLCPFARHVLDQHPEFDDVRADR
jgi:predicted GNAT family acetyltransferase